jgi:hypothetical protein
MTDPDGLAFLLLWSLVGLAVGLLALGLECWLARGMRRRRRYQAVRADWARRVNDGREL